MTFTASRWQGFGTTIFTEMSALAERTGAINLGQGFPDEDGPAEVLEAAERALRDGHNQYAPLPGVPALREAIAAHQHRFYGIEVDPDTRGAGHVRRHGGDRGRAAGDLRAGRRGRLPRALLRLLRGRDRDGRREPPPGHAAPAGLGDRPGGARRGDHAPGARAAAQLAAQPDGQGALAPGARADRRRVPRARPDRDHRRGLRAPRLRRRAHPARDAAGDGRAHADDLLAGQDVLGDGLEDGLGGRPAPRSSPRCARPSST